MISVEEGMTGRKVREMATETWQSAIDEETEAEVFESEFMNQPQLDLGEPTPYDEDDEEGGRKKRRKEEQEEEPKKKP